MPEIPAGWPVPAPRCGRTGAAGGSRTGAPAPSAFAAWRRSAPALRYRAATPDHAPSPDPRRVPAPARLRSAAARPWSTPPDRRAAGDDVAVQAQDRQQHLDIAPREVGRDGGQALDGGRGPAARAGDAVGAGPAPMDMGAYRREHARGSGMGMRCSQGGLRGHAPGEAELAHLRIGSSPVGRERRPGARVTAPPRCSPRSILPKPHPSAALPPRSAGAGGPGCASATAADRVR